MRLTSVLAVMVAAALAFPVIHAAEAKGRCEPTFGQGLGITLSIAKAKAYHRILADTGNWPEQKGFIIKPVYKCLGGNNFWRCGARSIVCKP